MKTKTLRIVPFPVVKLITGTDQIWGKTECAAHSACGLFSSSELRTFWFRNLAHMS